MINHFDVSKKQITRLFSIVSQPIAIFLVVVVIVFCAVVFVWFSFLVVAVGIVVAFVGLRNLVLSFCRDKVRSS